MLEDPAHGELAYLLTKHYFGDTVATVIKELYRYDRASLSLLRATHPEFKFQDLKKSLLILVKYQLVDYVKTIKSCEYSVVPQRLFAFYRLPSFIHALAQNEGELAASALAMLAKKGMIRESNLIDSLSQEYPSQPRDHITKTVRGLVARSYFAELQQNISINIERFNRSHRDNLIVETISDFNNKDTDVRLICRAMLDLSLDQTADDAAYTAPVDLFSIHEALPKDKFSDKKNLEAYLAKLASEPNYKFFVGNGHHEQRGPLYAINVGLVFDYLMTEHICSVITTKYGPKCCRLFRILLQKGALLLKQIEEIIMLPARDVREYSYMLNKEGLIRNRQVPKTLDNAPGKSVFILSVELDRVVNKVADLCCRSMYNLLARYEYELSRNEALLNRSKAVEELLGSSEQTEEWNQYFNSHELIQLGWIRHNLERLLLARNQVDETLFICHVWLTLRREEELA